MVPWNKTCIHEITATSTAIPAAATCEVLADSCFLTGEPNAVPVRWSLSSASSKYISQPTDRLQKRQIPWRECNRLAAVNSVSSVGCGPSPVGACLCQPPSLDHLLESLGQSTSSCCHLCGVREQWLPFTGSHAGNEDDGKQGQNADGAL